MSCCDNETDVKDEFDVMKMLLSVTETCFRAGHGPLVEVINAHTLVTNTQTSLLGVLCDEVRTIHKKKDDLRSQTARLGDIEQDVPTIADCVRRVENKTGVVSSFISRQNEAC